MTVTSAPKHRLADFLPYQLSITSNAVSERIAREYRARFNLKVGEWRIMAVLGDAGASTQRELTEATLMDKVAVNRACKVLADRELIIRKPNEKDGRSHHLALTNAGQEIYNEVMPLAKRMEIQLLSVFSEAEICQMRTLLYRMRDQAALLRSPE